MKENLRIGVIEMGETVKELYYYLEDRCEGLDSIYEDVILGLVGSYGLVVLKDAGLLETCGVINGRQLYVLCKLKGED